MIPLEHLISGPWPSLSEVDRKIMIQNRIDDLQEFSDAMNDDQPVQFFVASKKPRIRKAKAK
jgi:hypothetical protein